MRVYGIVRTWSTGHIVNEQQVQVFRTVPGCGR